MLCATASVCRSSFIVHSFAQLFICSVFEFCCPRFFLFLFSFSFPPSCLFVFFVFWYSCVWHLFPLLNVRFWWRFNGFDFYSGANSANWKPTLLVFVFTTNSTTQQGCPRTQRGHSAPQWGAAAHSGVDSGALWRLGCRSLVHCTSFHLVSLCSESETEVYAKIQGNNIYIYIFKMYFLIVVVILSKVAENREKIQEFKIEK